MERDTSINPWVIACVVMLATFMEVLDTSVANVALPHIAGTLSATVDESTWVLTSYLVSNAIVLPLSGWLSSLFGRKRFYMTCVLLFTVSSLLCGFATSLPMLIAFRIMQGLGGGALQPISQAILVESFPAHKRGMAMAVYGMGVVFAPVIGPTLGGWITDNYSWRWIFLINIPIGVLSLLLTSILIFDPPFLKRAKNAVIDYAGLGFLTVGLASLEIVLDEGQRQDWFSSPMIIASAAIAAFALIATVVWELRQKDPIIDLHLLGERNFSISVMSMFLLGFVLYGSTMLLPVFLQTLLGYSALNSGLVLSPGGVAIIICMPLVGFLLSKIEARWLVIFGLTVSAIGTFMMGEFNLEVDFRHALIARVVQSAGLAFLFVPINSMAFARIDKSRTSYATGLINLARNIGGSAGIATVTTMLARASQLHQNVLVQHVTPLNPAYNDFMGGAAQALGADRAHALLYGLLQRQASMLAFIDDFRLLGFIFLAIIPLMFLMRRTGPHHGPVHME